MGAPPSSGHEVHPVAVSKGSTRVQPQYAGPTSDLLSCVRQWPVPSVRAQLADCGRGVPAPRDGSLPYCFPPRAGCMCKHVREIGNAGSARHMPSRGMWTSRPQRMRPASHPLDPTAAHSLGWVPDLIRSGTQPSPLACTRPSGAACRASDPRAPSPSIVFAATASGSSLAGGLQGVHARAAAVCRPNGRSVRVGSGPDQVRNPAVAARLHQALRTGISRERPGAASPFIVFAATAAGSTLGQHRVPRRPDGGGAPACNNGVPRQTRLLSASTSALLGRRKGLDGPPAS